MSTNVLEVKKIVLATAPRKANQCINDGMRLRAAEPLFDGFWREGELALMFGAHSTGKSVLAVQIADALARGTPLDGFRMSKSRHKVLYVDLDCSDAQFQARYPRPKFAARLYRERPPYGADLCEWVHAMVKENGIRVVIIDSLSAIKRTHDGVRETLAAMRRLKQIRDEVGVSILVITDSFEPVREPWVSEDELKRSRVLCTAADTVFAIGRKRRPENGRYIGQIRSGNGRIVWDYRNAPVGTIKRLESGLLGFEFDKRFSPQFDKEKRQLICDIHARHEAGATYRMIAKDLGISKTRAHELCRKWNPAMDDLSEPGEDGVPARASRSGVQVSTGFRDPQSDYEYDEEDEYEEADEFENSPPCLGGVAAVAADRVVVQRESDRVPIANKKILQDYHPTAEAAPLLNKAGSFMNLSAIPFAAGLGRRSVYDLAFGYDSYGREIYVESQNEHTGKPNVWYQFDRQGNKRRFERGPFSIQVEHLNSGPFL